jgi:hypothetical protein
MRRMDLPQLFVVSGAKTRNCGEPITLVLETTRP